MTKPDNKATGYILLTMALVLFYIGSYFREPVLSHHKLLAATSHEDGTVFEQAVILVLTHTPSGAMGLILNKDENGGPVGKDQVHVLHSPDVMLGGSLLIEDLGIAWARGEKAAEELRNSTKKPAWYAVVKGYAGWGPKQLDGEIRREVWEVVDYDPDLVMKTPMDRMHAAAIEKAKADSGAASPPAEKGPVL
jgi:putative transcriptional regulator